jgi:hypothetical protein
MSFWGTLGDVFVGVADTGLSAVGLGNVISDGAYSSNSSAQTWQKVQDLKNKAMDTVLNVVAPGTGTVLGAVQQNNRVNPSNSPQVTMPVNYQVQTGNTSVNGSLQNGQFSGSQSTLYGNDSTLMYYVKQYGLWVVGAIVGIYFLMKIMQKGGRK